MIFQSGYGFTATALRNGWARSAELSTQIWQIYCTNVKVFLSRWRYPLHLSSSKPEFRYLYFISCHAYPSTSSNRRI